MNKESTPKGRPKISYANASDRTKLRIVTESERNHDTLDEALEVAMRKMKIENNTSGIKILKMISDKKNADEILALINQNKKAKPTTMPEEKAVGVLIDCGLTKNDYLTLRKSSIEYNHDLFPPYQEVNDYR